MQHVYPPSSIPFLALGAWILSVGWFGFNVMSAQAVEGIQGLVAMNSLMAMVGGILAATVVGDKDPGFIHNGPLAGLVAICAGSDVVSPLGALVIGLVAGALFVKAFTWTQKTLKVDDVLGVWPLHGLCGVWGAIAVGIFGSTALGGLGGVAMMSQILGTLAGVGVALIGGFIVYWLVNKLMTLRMSDEDQYQGADLSIHKSTPTRHEKSFNEAISVLKCIILQKDGGFFKKLGRIFYNNVYRKNLGLSSGVSDETPACLYQPTESRFMRWDP